MRKLLLLFLLLAILTSCDNKKEKDIEQREEALKIREEQFAEKEGDYTSLLKMRDSLIRTKDVSTDSIPEMKTWPDTLQLVWNSKMICRESNCSNYVIGDQRNETWHLLSDSIGIYTNVVNNKKLIRTFRARYTDAKIYLDFKSDSTSASKVQMQVVIDDIRKEVMKGTQTITGQDNCTSKFSVELTPSTKK